MAELNEIDVLDKREGKGKTRKVKEYRIKDPEIKLKYKFEKEEKEFKDPDLYKQIYESILERTENVYGSLNEDSLISTDESKEELNCIIKNIRKILEYNEKTIGITPTKKLVKRSTEEVFKKSDYEEKENPILDVLPPKYFDLLEEEFK